MLFLESKVKMKVIICFFLHSFSNFHRITNFKLVPVLNVLEIADEENLPNVIDEGYFDAPLRNRKIIFHMHILQAKSEFIHFPISTRYLVQYAK